MLLEKKKTVELVGQTINLLRKEQDESPIVLKWVETQLNSNHNEPNNKSDQSATMVTTVTATRASSTTTSATTATASTTAVAATPSTRTDQKPIRKSNRIKNATSVSQCDFLWGI
jgi:hypothetical protein